MIIRDINMIETPWKIGDGISVVEEALGGGEKRRYIEGPFVMLEKPNRNGRWYTRENFLPMLDEYNKEWVHADRAMGELTHSGKPAVNPLNACIKIVENKVGFDGDPNLIWAKALVLKTPYGKLLDAILDDVKMGVSSRCKANIHPSGFTEVIEIVTLADVVVDPSVRDAMVSVVQEQFEYLTGGHAETQKMFDQFMGGMRTARNDELVDLTLKKFLNSVSKLV